MTGTQAPPATSPTDDQLRATRLFRYTAPDGTRQLLETPTGGMSTNGRDGQTLPLLVDPHDPAHAVPKASGGTLATMGCFAAISLFFAVFGAFAIITVLT